LNKLSAAIASAYCEAAWPLRDNFFAVGCASIYREYPAAGFDGAEYADMIRQGERIIAGHRAPWIPTGFMAGIENDLFTPKSEIRDGRLTVWVPVSTQEPLSSTVIARDWRFLGLVWWVLKKNPVVPASGVIIAFDVSGRAVAAEIVPADVLASFGKVVALFDPAASTGRPETVSGQCNNCKRSAECKTWQGFGTEFAAVKPGVRETEDRKAVRLLSARTMLSLRTKPLEDQKKYLDKEIVKLVRDGRLRLGKDENIEMPARKSVAWDFGTVRRVLERAGLWQDTLGDIRVAEMNAFYQTVSPELKKELAVARTEKLGQPSISEGVRHARFGVSREAGSPAFIGLSGNRTQAMGGR